MGRGSKAVQPPKPSKYRNVRVEIDGHKFDSKREAAIYQELKLREKAGEIRDLKLQVPIVLWCPDCTPENAPWDSRRMVEVSRYIADFTFEEKTDPGDMTVQWDFIVADCKGGRNTQMFQLKKRWLFLQSGIEIRELR